MDFNFNSINIMDQNNIILILLLIAVLVAFYAIYLAMENSKRVKKISLEMVDLVKLVQESSNLRHEPPFLPQQPNPNNVVPNQASDLDEYPTLEEINDENSFNEQPLDEKLKNQIDNLDNLNEEELRDLERQLEENTSDENQNLNELEIDGLEEVVDEEVVDEEVVDEAVEEEVEEEVVDEAVEEEVLDEEVEEEVVEDEEVEEEEVEEEVVDEEVDEEVEETDGLGNAGSLEQDQGSYPVLGELTEGGLNELNCEELRDICKREELRTRGRKAELVERILKKRDALA